MRVFSGRWDFTRKRRAGRQTEPPRTKCILWSVCFLSRFGFFSTSLLYVEPAPASTFDGGGGDRLLTAAAEWIRGGGGSRPRYKEAHYMLVRCSGNGALSLGSIFTFPFLCTQAAAWANICPRHHQTRYFSQSRFFFLFPPCQCRHLHLISTPEWR